MSRSSFSQPWYSQKEQEKQYKMTRGLSQDVLKRLEKSIRKTYPEKKIKEIDIGKICTEWHMDVLAFIGADKEKQDELIAEIRDSYHDGINLEEDEDWLDEYAEATTIFSEEQKTFAQIPRLSFKDKAEKPEKTEQIEEWFE